MKPSSITILGSTGSIGTHTLAVVAAHPERFKIVALSANQAWEKLFEQCYRFQPAYAVIADPRYYLLLRDKVAEANLSTVVLSGSEGLCIIAQLPEVDQVVAAIVGSAGLLPTFSAVEAGKRVLLANKESLVVSGELIMAAAKKSNAILLPIDSEHNALFQCLPAGSRTGVYPSFVTKLILTASGGPFLHFSAEKMETITPEMACQHPIWKMGKKVTVDSATLMNKGLELIEASHLFQCSSDQLEVLIHPQSIIHSLVEYEDGSLLAQLGSPDMRIPIAYCLGWPERIDSGVKRLSLADMGTLTFYPPDVKKFPCLGLAREVMKLKKAAPIVLNASNEVAVQAFLDGKLKFTEIPMIVEQVLHKLYDDEADTLETILSVDKIAREEASHWILTRHCRV